MNEVQANGVFGSYVQEARAMRGLTQEQLAERCDISLNHLQNIEINRRRPSFQVLTRLMQALELSFDHYVFAGKSTSRKHADRLAERISNLHPRDRILLQELVQAMEKHMGLEREKP